MSDKNKHHNPHDEYLELIKGKSVAIVGPAAYMKDSELGEEIDAHDLVVRINRSIETTKQYPKDVGTKCQILYSCLIETAQNAGKINVHELRDDYGVEFVVAPPESDIKGVSRQTNLHYMVNKETVSNLMSLMPLRVVEASFHTALAEHVDCRPNTGFMAIYDLMQQQLKSLSVYGFSFYLDGFIPGCKSGIVEEKGMTEEEFATAAMNSKRHVQINMWNFAKKTIFPGSVLKPYEEGIYLDPTLRKILSMQEFSRQEFHRVMQ